MARYLSWPAVSQIWALIVLPSTWNRKWFSVLNVGSVLLDLNWSGGKLDPNCWFWLQVELISGESWQQIWLSNSRVSNQNNFEQVIIFIIASTHLLGYLLFIWNKNSEIHTWSLLMQRRTQWKLIYFLLFRYKLALSFRVWWMQWTIYILCDGKDN